MIPRSDFKDLKRKQSDIRGQRVDDWRMKINQVLRKGCSFTDWRNKSGKGSDNQLEDTKPLRRRTWNCMKDYSSASCIQLYSEHVRTIASDWTSL
jgi:hypothetical protein